jgi:hypothetical protein
MGFMTIKENKVQLKILMLKKLALTGFKKDESGLHEYRLPIG